MCIACMCGMAIINTTSGCKPVFFLLNLQFQGGEFRLSGTEPLRQIDMDQVLTSGSLSGEIVSILARNQILLEVIGFESLSRVKPLT